MKRLLVSNDDGIDSPALLPLLRALTPLGEVHCVVPDRQRSWIGAGVTRLDPVEIKRVERDGFLLHACTGTPADSVNIGLHSLLADGLRFDLLVSGINLGLNQGDAFISSSGTIGAAAEAVSSGLPAIATSLGPQPTDAGWTERLVDPARAKQWDDAAAVVADVVRLTLESGLPSGADILNLNMPEGTTTATPRRVTSVARTAYDRLFHPLPENAARFQAQFGVLRERRRAGEQLSDFEALARGIVSITPLRLAEAADVSESWIEALESTGTPAR
ncbi:MAG: 5'/3'-nucleotidase SurE [Myxococcota bacterium]|nr:5'/3'-nucleotidase SurE [Myxococcota bacterium]